MTRSSENTASAPKASSGRPTTGNTGRWSSAWLVARGSRKLRYRGVTKNNAWLHHRTAALNLRRLLTLGLDHQQRAWILA